MGITIDYNLLLKVNRWPIELVSAIQEMADEVGTKPLRPPQARKLIQIHIEPLSPKLYPGSRIPGIYPAWNDFTAIGRAIESISNNRMDLCIGSFLIYLPEWAAYGKRTHRKPRIYCDLCWRHAVNDRKFCSDHTQEINPANYRKAKRLRETFQMQLKSLKILDHSTPCNHDWEKVIHSQLSLSFWLSTYRKQTYEQMKMSSDITFQSLLEHLDKPNKNTESLSLAHARSELHTTLLQDPNQLFGMLRRCEASLIAQASKPHGGHRKNAGRKSLKTK